MSLERTPLWVRVCACTAAFILAGCKQEKVVPATEVLVVVNSDLEIGTQLTRIHVQVKNKAGDSTSTSDERNLALVAESQKTAKAAITYKLPLSFSVVPPKGEDASRFRIVVTGLRDDQEVVEQQVIVTFQPGKTVLLPVFLGSNCFEKLCRDEQEQGKDVVCAALSGLCESVPTGKNLKVVDPKTSAIKLAQQGAGASVRAVPDNDAGVPPVSADDSDGGTPQITCTTSSCGDKMCCYVGCIDPMTNNQNCGGCDKLCPARSACNAGVCTCSKATDRVCNKQCTDVVADNMNCGACGVTCKSPTKCMNGACTCPNSAAGDSLCSDVCVDTQTDPKNCGKCGIECKAPTTCMSGWCSCAYNEELCGDVCADTQTDNAHCGDCDTACEGQTSCVLGKCKCPKLGSSVCHGKCVQLSTDANNCGACGTKCDSGSTCCAGKCADLNSDANNCKTCGTKCSMTTDTCAMGTCKCGTANACMAGFFGGGGTCSNGLCQ